MKHYQKVQTKTERSWEQKAFEVKWKAFFIIFKGLPVAKISCLKLSHACESAFKKKVLQELPLDGSSTFQSLMVLYKIAYVSKNNVIKHALTGWQLSQDFIMGLNLLPIKNRLLNNFLADSYTMVNYTNSSLRTAEV